MLTNEQRARAVELLRVRKRNYQLVFAQPGSTEVLEDLQRFCRGKASCWHPDPRIHAALEGRREVFLRIEQHLEHSPEELVDLYGATVLGEEGEE